MDNFSNIVSNYEPIIYFVVSQESIIRDNVIIYIYIYI